MKKTGQLISLFILLFLIWIFLTDTSRNELIIGFIFTILIVFFFSKQTRVYSDFRFSPKAILYFFAYLFLFLKELVKSNIDVAKRTINPKLPINPGIVRVKTKLHSKLGRLMLANSITLTPGTLTIDAIGDTMYIHWIDVTAQDSETASKEIVQKFERYLEVIFG